MLILKHLAETTYQPRYFSSSTNYNVGQCPTWWPPCRI